MGTRSMTIVKSNDKTLVSIYGQYDGYISGHGQDLVDIILPRKMVNGLPFGDNSKFFNGPGCMAAAIVSLLKGDQAGNFYLVPEDDTDGVDFVYTISSDQIYRKDTPFDVSYTEPRITVTSYGEQLFDGTVEEFAKAIEKGQLEDF